MPSCFQFLENNEPVSLNRIDEEICAYYGLTPNPKNYSMSYNFVVMSGLAILNKSGGFNIKEKQIDDFCDKNHEGAYKELLKEFLIKRYTFKAWWEGK